MQGENATDVIQIQTFETYPSSRKEVEMQLLQLKLLTFFLFAY
jgi:hypothetical protein